MQELTDAELQHIDGPYTVEEVAQMLGVELPPTTDTD